MKVTAMSLMLLLIWSCNCFADSKFNVVDMFKESEVALKTYIESPSKQKYDDNGYSIELNKYDDILTIMISQTTINQLVYNKSQEETLSLYYAVPINLVSKQWLSSGLSERRGFYNSLMKCYDLSFNNETVDTSICTQIKRGAGHIKTEDEEINSTVDGVWLTDAMLNKYNLKHAHLSREISITTNFKSTGEDVSSVKSQMTADDWFNKGIEYEDSNQINEAIDAYTKSLSLEPNNSGTLNNRAILYKNIGDYKKAMDDVTKSIKSNPNNHKSYLTKANIYFKLGQYKLAVNEYTKAIKKKPDFVTAYKNRAVTYEKLYNYKSAIKDYEKIIAMAENNEEARRELDTIIEWRDEAKGKLRAKNTF